MNRPMTVAAITAAATVALFTAMTAQGSVFDHYDRLPRVVDDTADPPPFYVPDSPPDTEQALPDYGRGTPPFPLLPDEDEHASRSIGGVTDGYLFNGRRIQLPHPHLEFLPRQYNRGFHYTGGPMLELIEDAAAHVADHPDGRRVHLGNFSRRGGGNIPHSVSHNNGRDADIMFFVLDEDGEPTRPPDLVQMDEDGFYHAADDEDANDPQLVLQFDTEMNWRFVEGLIESDAADIQYIFVSNPLRRKLLEEARRQDAAPSTRRIARRVLVQPGGTTLPHDDHFHIRIHCTDRDLASGCRERGRPGPTWSPNRRIVGDVIDRAAELLDDDDPHWRRTAIARLDLMDDHGLEDRIAELVADPAPKVRIAAARALVDHRPATDALAEQLRREDDPAVFAGLADTLATLGDSATDALIAAIDRDDHIDLGAAGTLPTAAVAADALARNENPAAVEPLIAALDDVAPQVRTQAVQALRLLTNHQLVPDRYLVDDDHVEDVITAWQDWWDDHHHKSHDQWVALGFDRAGFDVDDLGESDVWELCRAISDVRHLNVNAQRTLESIAGVSHDSIHWDPYDANFFWRRWFERRQDRFDIPPVPEELSTADGYEPPE